MLVLFEHPQLLTGTLSEMFSPVLKHTLRFVDISCPSHFIISHMVVLCVWFLLMLLCRARYVGHIFLVTDIDGCNLSQPHRIVGTWVAATLSLNVMCAHCPCLLSIWLVSDRKWRLCGFMCNFVESKEWWSVVWKNVEIEERSQQGFVSLSKTWPVCVLQC